MNREDLNRAIDELAGLDPRYYKELWRYARGSLDLVELVAVYDQLADFHQLATGVEWSAAMIAAAAAADVGLDLPDDLRDKVVEILERGVDVDISATMAARAAAPAAGHRCGHCDSCQWRDSAGRCCMDPASPSYQRRKQRQA